MILQRVSQRVLGLRVDKGDPTPIYLQIAGGLRTLLRKGTLLPGASLPPERLLCLHFGISHMTLRQANELLGHEALIKSERGRGTFVALHRIEKQQETYSVTEKMKRKFFSRRNIPVELATTAIRGDLYTAIIQSSCSPKKA